MWHNITVKLPPVGKEVLFLTEQDKEIIIGRIEQYKDAKTGKPVYGISIKQYFFGMNTCHEHNPLNIVAYWTDIPEDPSEEVVERFSLMDIE